MIKVVGCRTLALALLLVLCACDSTQERVKKYITSGDEYLERGEYALADLQFRNALQLNANIVEAWYGMAMASERRGYWTPTHEYLRNVVALDKQHVAAHIKLGTIYLAAGRLDSGLEHSSIAYELAPKNADALALRAALLYRLSNLEGAVLYASKSLKIDPKNTEAIAVMVTERLAARDFKRAIEYIGQGLAADPDNAPLHLMKINAFEQAGDIDGAAGVYHALIASDPQEMNYRRGLSRLYLSQHRLAEAEPVLRAIVEDWPTDIEAKLQLVEFLREHRGEDAAERQLLHFVEEDTSVDYELDFALADFYAGVGRRVEQLAIYDTIIEENRVTASVMEAMSRSAVMAIEDGEEDGARSLIDAMLKRDRRYADALILQATLVMQNDRADEAIQILRRVVRDDPESADALVMLAQAHEAAGSQGLAKDYYADALSAEPESPQVATAFARYLSRVGSYSKAAEILQTQLSRNPTDSTALQVLAQVRISQQDWSAAQALSERIRSAGGESAISDQIRGVALRGQGRYAESIESLKRVHHASPHTAQPLISLVRTYVEADRTAEAERFLRSLLDIHEKNFYAQLLLARLCFHTAQVEEAEREYLKAIAINPDMELGYWSLASFYRSLERFEEAELVLTRGLAKLPENEALSMTLAGIYEASLQTEEAITLYEGMLNKNPSLDVAANNLAGILADRAGDEESLDRALALALRFRTSTIGHYQDTLGWVYYRRGEYLKAIGYLEDAVDLMPALPEVRYHLGMSYVAIGQKDRAREQLTEAISHGDNFANFEQARTALAGL